MGGVVPTAEPDSVDAINRSTIGAMLLRARKRAGLTQRELAVRTGVAQPTVARIERGQVDPIVGTLRRLLNACGEDLETRPVLGVGVDRTGIRELLRMTPEERVASLVEEVAALERLRAAHPVT